jgi:hypothetical protein
MCPGNLARQIHVVIGDIRLWVPGPVLEFHFQTTAELVEIDLRPIDAEFAANPLGHGGTYPLSFGFHGCVLLLFTSLLRSISMSSAKMANPDVGTYPMRRSL